MICDHVSFNLTLIYKLTIMSPIHMAEAHADSLLHAIVQVYR
jgi:hypothetical protein